MKTDIQQQINQQDDIGLYYKKLENILNVHQSEIRFWHFGPSEEAYMTRVYEDERLSQYSFKKQLY